MHIFVTGATGFIGSAVVRELLGAGHQVLGLTRSDRGAQALVAAGAGVHRGDLDDLDSLQSGAALSDGVIHLAFNHDFSQYEANCAADRCVIEALGAALVGSEQPLVITSGTTLVASGVASDGLATEDDLPLSSATLPRAASEEAAAAVGARGVRVSAVRLAPSVHDDGDQGFVPLLIGIAREKGVSAYIGDGANRWPAVHRLDAARLFRLAVEKGAADAKYHGVGDEGVPFREIAEVIGRRLNLPVASVSPNEAAAHFGWFADFAALNNPISSALTQERLDWHPAQIGLIADLEHGRYFEN